MGAQTIPTGRTKSMKRHFLSGRKLMYVTVRDGSIEDQLLMDINQKGINAELDIGAEVFDFHAKGFFS